ANTVAEAEAMADAAAKAAERGVFAMVGFTYRRVPATAFARQLVAEGRIGRVTQVRASYRQDWLVDPQVPLAWRLRKELAGSGALGDIGAHAVDLAQFITGMRLESVSGTLETIVKERPLPADSTPGEVASLGGRSEEHTSELQSRENLVCRLLLEKKKETPHPTPPDRSLGELAQ